MQEYDKAQKGIEAIDCVECLACISRGNIVIAFYFVINLNEEYHI